VGSAFAIAGFLALIVFIVIPIHELGHLLVARRFGFKVTEYFVGFGPKLWSRKPGEIEYGIKAIPAGGYVKIAGMNPYESVAPEDLARAYGSKPIWQRALVILAGPLSHFLVGAILFFALFATYGDSTSQAVVVGDVAPTLGTHPSPASEAGLRVGDVVLRVGDLENPTRDTLGPHVTRFAREHPGEPLEYVIERDGRRITLPIVPQLVTGGGGYQGEDRVHAGGGATVGPGGGRGIGPVRRRDDMERRHDDPEDLHAGRRADVLGPVQRRPSSSRRPDQPGRRESTGRRRG